MKELDPWILLAIMREMLGPLLWVLVGLALLGLGAFTVLLARERRLDARRLVRSQVLGLLGGALALVLMAKVSSSGFTDAGGPIDWILIALVFAAGLIGSAILAYTVMGWCPRCRADSMLRDHRRTGCGRPADRRERDTTGNLARQTREDI